MSDYCDDLRLTGITLAEEAVTNSETEWKEECEALKAIFDDQLLNMDDHSVELMLKIPDDLLCTNNDQIWKQVQSKV